jgi:acetyl-CoA C-acetyltransferase
MGQVLAAGAGQNPARQALLKAGLPKEVPGLTINAVCGSGLKAVMLAAQAVAWGDAEIVVAGGQENMSAAPHVLPNSRDGQRMGDWKLQDTMIVDGLWDVYNQYHMGVTAENVAKEHNIDRAAQDALALGSQQKAAAAQEAGKFKDEIVAVTSRRRRATRSVRQRRVHQQEDQCRSAGRPAARLRQGRLGDGRQCLGPERRRRRGGGDEREEGQGTRPEAAGHDPGLRHQRPGPQDHGHGTRAGHPQGAAARRLEDRGRQPVRAERSLRGPGLRGEQGLGIDPSKVNVNGGAIAIGHPIGASGARILVTLLHEMQRREARKGIAALCIGGGMGVSLAVERAERAE